MQGRSLALGAEFQTVHRVFVDQSNPDSLLSQGHHRMRVYEAQYQSSDHTEIAIKLRVTYF
jgi:hypothetical protein